MVDPYNSSEDAPEDSSAIRAHAVSLVLKRIVSAGIDFTALFLLVRILTKILDKPVDALGAVWGLLLVEILGVGIFYLIGAG